MAWRAHSFQGKFGPASLHGKESKIVRAGGEDRGKGGDRPSKGSCKKRGNGREVTVGPTWRIIWYGLECLLCVRLGGPLRPGLPKDDFNYSSDHTIGFPTKPRAAKATEDVAKEGTSKPPSEYGGGSSTDGETDAFIDGSEQDAEEPGKGALSGSVSWRPNAVATTIEWSEGKVVENTAAHPNYWWQREGPYRQPTYDAWS